MSARSLRVLRALSIVFALSSLAAQAIALFTNEWLYSEEFMENKQYLKFNMSQEFEYYRKITVSGLWNLCWHIPRNTSLNCTKIDYFSPDEYTPDPNDSTLAIPYSARKAAVFIFISSGILLIGELLCFISNLWTRRGVLTFASGIAFILAGLMILAGVVTYIATFKGEVGNKLRPKSSFQGPMFIYNYGYSFLLAIGALIFNELAGACHVFLFIRQHQIDWKIEWEREQFCEFLPPLPVAGLPTSAAGAIGIVRPLHVPPVMGLGGGVDPQSPEPSPGGLPLPAPFGTLPTSSSDPNSAMLQMMGFPDHIPPPPSMLCKRHGRGRRYSRSRDIDISRETSPSALQPLGGFNRGSRHGSFNTGAPSFFFRPTAATHPFPGSESLRDMTHFGMMAGWAAPRGSNTSEQMMGFNGFSRETTCNTMSTGLGDVLLPSSRDFSRETFLNQQQTLRESCDHEVEEEEEDEEAEVVPLGEPSSSASQDGGRRSEFVYDTLRRTTPV